MAKIVIASDFHVVGQASATLLDMIEKLTDINIKYNSQDNPEYRNLLDIDFEFDIPEVDLSKQLFYFAGDRTTTGMTMADVIPSYQIFLKAVSEGKPSQEAIKIQEHFQKDNPSADPIFSLRYPIIAQNTADILDMIKQKTRLNPVLDSGGNSCDLIHNSIVKTREDYDLELLTNNEILGNTNFYNKAKGVKFRKQGKSAFLFIPYSTDKDGCSEYLKGIEMATGLEINRRGIDHLYIITHENIAPQGLNTTRNPLMTDLKDMIETAEQNYKDSEVVVVCGHLHTFPDEKKEYNQGRLIISPIGVNAKNNNPNTALDTGRYIILDTISGERQYHDVVFKAEPSLMDNLEKQMLKKGNIEEKAEMIRNYQKQ